MIGTPFGKNFFFREWERAKPYASFQFGSIDSPYFSKKEWETVKSETPQDVFKQEYRALFLDNAASVFRNVRELVSDCLEEPKGDHRYVLGVDLAKYQDFTVLTMMDKYSHKIVYLYRGQRENYTLQKERIAEVAKKYNRARIIIDSTGLGDPIVDDLKRDTKLMVDDYRFTGKSKEQLIDKLRIFIEQKAIIIPPDEGLLDELESFGYQLINPKTGEPLKNIKYSAPQGLHDDYVDSLALAVWGLSEAKKDNPRKLIQPKPLKVKTFQYF